MSGSVVLFALYVGLPLAIALVVVWGDWRIAIRAYLVWVVLLFSAFFLMTFDFDHMMYGVMVYGMFFSVIAVPVLALAMKVWRVLRTRFKPHGA